MPELISQSEKFITSSIDDEGIKEIVFEVWDQLKVQPIAGFQNFIEQADVEEITDLVLQQIHSDPNGDGDNNKATNSHYILGLIETGIRTFYKEYGNKKLSVVIKDLDLSTDYLNEQLIGVLPSIAATLIESGYMEQRLRERLSDFYLSDDAQAIFR